MHALVQENVGSGDGDGREEDVTNLSKIGGRNVTVNDIIEKGMA